MTHKHSLIPSVFTVFNLLFGFIAIIKASDGDFHTSAWFIIFAILCDGMDGKFARLTGCETKFGLFLDSLADMLSSGIAPAFLIYISVFNTTPWIGGFFCFLFLFCGSYRLARFNADQEGDRSKGYIGLPIPVASMTLASFLLFQTALELHIHIIIWIVILSLLSIIMISYIPYAWPKLAFRENFWKKLQSGMMLICVIAMAIFPHVSLFPLLSLYIFLGILHWAVALFKSNVLVPFKKN